MNCLMDRFALKVSVRDGGDAARMAPELAAALGVHQDRPLDLRFGLRKAEAPLEISRDLPTDQLLLPHTVAAQLSITGPLQVSAMPAGSRAVALGPLVALLISQAKLAALLEGKMDSIYCRYAAYAREAGGLLLFLTVDGLDAGSLTARGHVHPGHKGGACAWAAVEMPFPGILYDRCFGYAGREEAAKAREIARQAGATVINRPVKITKLQAFGVLEQYPELAPHLPYTALVTPSALTDAMARYEDLYLKPDALYKGKGVYRLTRQGGQWLLKSREEWGNWEQRFTSADELTVRLEGLLPPEDRYLMQEGLPLATYMGNRFDFRSLVQRDGRGRWVVSGMVARVAPDGSVITSPRSGGQVATAEQVLRHAFPEHWRAVLSDLEESSILLADRVDRHLGPCAELGLDVGVVRDGAVKLIEVNGKPLRVSLSRLGDPLVEERIHRYPIHFAAHLDLRGERDASGHPEGD